MISGFPKFKQYTEATMPLPTSVPSGTEVFNATYQVKMRSNGTSWEWLGVGKSTWGDKPAIATLGKIICITDVGENGALFRGNGTNWVRTSSLNYANITTQSTITGTTTETEVGRITVKGGTLGKKGRLNFTTLGAATANANTKTLRAKVGATTIASIVSAGASLFAFNFWLASLNSESSQRTNIGGILSIDTSVDFDIVFTAQLTNTADNLGIVFVAGDMQ